MERFYQGFLPHYRIAADGIVYFVTWRLAPGQPPLRDDERDVVAAALRHWEAVKCRLHGFVVMDDHVHVLVSPLAEVALERLLQSWKSYTASRLIRGSGRLGPVWQHESYDRVVRNEVELEQLAEYVAGNPARRWPHRVDYRWAWSAGER